MTTTATTTNVFAATSTAKCPTLTLTFSGHASTATALVTAVAAYTDGYAVGFNQLWTGTYATTALATQSGAVTTAFNAAIGCAVADATAVQFDAGAYIVQTNYAYVHADVATGITGYAQTGAMPALYAIAATVAGTPGTLEAGTVTAKDGTDAKYIMTSSTAALAAISITFTNTLSWAFPSEATPVATGAASSTEGDRWNTGDVLSCYGNLTGASATMTALVAGDSCGTAVTLVLGAEAGLAFGAAALASALAF